MKKNLLYIILIVLFSACAESDPVVTNNDQIALSFFVDNYKSNPLKTNSGTTEEKQVDDLYLFLFPKNINHSLIKIYINSATFIDGSWSKNDNKIILDYYQSEIGERDIYLIANCSHLKTDLDAVSSVADLKSVLVEIDDPWSGTSSSDNLKTPLLMSAYANHNFSLNHELDYLSLIRAVAKLQLNITLKTEHQAPITRKEGVTDVSQYKYKFTAFDKTTYVIKPTTKTDDLVSSVWENWEATPTITAYTTDVTGNVKSMTLTTYLNERDNAGAKVEINLPYNPGGLLPPPEFGDDNFTLPLPDKIVRNTLYVYDIEI